MRKMLKKQGVPDGQIDQLINIINKNPDLFKKIAEEVQVKMKSGKGQMEATMEVMRSHEGELKKLV